MAGASAVESEILSGLFASRPMREAFSDAARLQGMLDFEAALARAEAKLGVVPRSAVAPIEVAAKAEGFDLAALGRAAAAAGNAAIPMVKMLGERVAAIEPEAARYVHWGATSQDAIDTGLVLQMRTGIALLVADLDAIADTLVRLAETYRTTPMVGRTLLQAAVPRPFGLKAAEWLGLASRAASRLERVGRENLCLQFGGAAGTLGTLGGRGPAVAEALAAELRLRLPEMPWHSARDRIAEIACAVAMAAGAMAKLARDVMLLMQTEVREVLEPAAPGRGGSSSMPHKRNPSGSAPVIAAARQAASLAGLILHDLDAELERGVGGWQSEWGVVPSLFCLASGTTMQMRMIVTDLEVDPERMRANLEATGGLVMAEAVSMALAGTLGRQQAHERVEAATRRAAAAGRPLAAVLAEDAEISGRLTPQELDALFDPQNAFGAAEHFIDAAIAANKARLTGR